MEAQTKIEIKTLMQKNLSILQISKEMELTYSEICKAQTEIMADHDFNKVKVRQFANATIMEARAFEIAENYHPSNEREYRTLLSNLEKCKP